MLTFSDTTNYDGIIQAIERLVYSSDYGRISGNTKELAQWTVRTNLALNRVTALMTRFAGSWRVGDWNHGTYDVATRNIVSGTREIALANPEDVLFIFRVAILQDATTSDYLQIHPFDIRETGTRGYIENRSSYIGVPFRYEKVGGYLVLDPTPNYSATNGVKYYYQRAPHPFATSDTTARAAIPSIFDQLIPLYAVDLYATENTNVTLKQLVAADMARMEADIEAFLQERSRSDGKGSLRVVKRSSR